MVRSQFSIKIFGVHFSNSVLDNSNWAKSHSLTKKSHTCEEGGHTSEFPFEIYWWILILKKRKNHFWKREKICWRYQHFTHVYQKPQSYEVQFLRFKVRQNFLSFWAIFGLVNPLTPNNPQNQNFKKWKKHLGMSSF